MPGADSISGDVLSGFGTEQRYSKRELCVVMILELPLHVPKSQISDCNFMLTSIKFR